MTDLDKFTDQELISLLNEGDHQAFNEIHSRHFDVMFKAAFRVLDDKDACLDIVQEVFTWFWHNRASHRISSIGGYLVMAVKYQTSNYTRSEKVRENFRLKTIEQSFSLNEETLELQELKAIIDNFTNDLPEKCKQIFKMSRERHLSNKEIASMLNISEKTVSVQISRALSKLRGQLGGMSYWMHFFV